MRIAIVGAGISGLTAAHLLHREHDITVFESADRVGGHTNTISVKTNDGEWDVDTGFIVFNDRNYPNFERLLRELGVPWQPSEMSFSVAATGYDFEYAGTPRGLFAQRSNLTRPWFLRMVREYRRFSGDARDLLAAGDTTTSLGHFLEERNYSKPFIDRLLVPQASAVWSADPSQMWTFPAGFLCEFFDNHGMLSLSDRPRWRTIAGGSQRYVDALIAQFADRIRTASPVARIERGGDGVDITVAGREPQRFDEVVIAAHSDQALAMLADPSEAEHELLSAIPYEPNQAILHTDRSLLPRRERVWSSWNYHLLDEPSGKTTVTYHMNTLQSLRAPHEFCVTLNQPQRVDPATIVRTIDYAHPVFTPAGIAAQARHGEISGVNRTHYCGAYWGWGFHEDGVVSAQTVARALERVAAWRSAIYEGFVSHRRHTPVDHGFRYDHAMLFLDLDELPEVFDAHPLWSARGRALARFDRADYLGDRTVALDVAVRDLAHERTGVRPDGPIRLLTNVRMLGHCFNPVSFYYCYAAGGEALRAVVAEVTNTPWGERHAYVMGVDGDGAPGQVLGQSFDKVFHVSPFMGMDHRYDWRLTAPGEQLVAHISSHREEQLVFDATLSLRRRALDRRALTRLLVRYPATTLRVSARIYGQALALKLKGAPYHPHPVAP